MYQYLTLKKENEVATITLNRPEVGNAFNVDLYIEVREAMEDCSEDASVRVVVITGAGKHFSSGGDIKHFKRRIDEGKGFHHSEVLKTGMMINAIRLCPKPVVAKINGVATGAGAAVALACDFRVMSVKSKFVFAFSNMAFSGDTNMIYSLERIVGTAKTAEWMALGTIVGGEEAFRLGLTTRLAGEGEGELDQTADQLITELLGRPTGAIGRQKRLYYEFFFNDILPMTVREGDYMCECALSADQKEAVYAFLEKRKPHFTGM